MQISRKLVPLLLCLLLTGAACNGDEEKPTEGDGTPEAQTAPFGSADLEDMVLAEAPEGLELDENAAGPETVYGAFSDEPRIQAATDAGFELGYLHDFVNPSADPSGAPSKPVGDLNTTRVVSEATLFSSSEGASEAIAFQQDHGNPQAAEREAEPLEELGDEAFFSRSVFQDPGQPPLYSFAYVWRVDNAIGLLAVQSPKDSTEGGPAEADMQALAEELATQMSDLEPTGEDLDIPAQATPGTVLFEDDFSDQNVGWELHFPGEPPGSASSYVQEQFQVTLDEAGGGRFNDTGEISKEYADFTDVSVEADVENAGAPESGWGLICREQKGETYYAFVLTGEGRVNIVESVAPTEPFAFLASLGPDEELASTFSEPHHMRADCVGDDITRLSLYVNDELVAEGLDDDPLTSGAAGMWTESPPEVGAKVLFDNFAVKEATTE